MRESLGNLFAVVSVFVVLQVVGLKGRGLLFNCVPLLYVPVPLKLHERHDTVYFYSDKFVASG